MQIMDQFPTRNTQSALRQDSSWTATAMTRDVSSPSDIISIQDDVIRSKAGSIIRMMEDVLTTPVFQQGNVLYLQR